MRIPSRSHSGSGPGSLTGRVVLVTGVSRRIGIGAGLVERLVADGACVLASGWEAYDATTPWGGDPDGGEAFVRSLGVPTTRLQYVAADLEDPEAPDRLVRETLERFGRIDAVVADHARSSHTAFADVTAAELDRCWAVNARASLLLAQSLGARRAPGPGGRVVLFTSGQHIGPMAGEIAYAVSKGALHQMTASLADALADAGITVNCINPGPVDTGYLEGAAHDRVARTFPGGRWGTPGDVANLVAWLLCDEGGWITGQVINSDGGFNLRIFRGPPPDRR